ncbi:MAG: amino acid adenylation domain-containing protein [Bacteroidales bacterium]|jgi:amino acid adenylation domain-containing protein|nr:amino acid adenylation domain-containing protein [Bacteroidales bacterium]
MTDLEEDILASLGGRLWDTARRFPGRTALEKGDRQVTYRELFAAASGFAHAIAELENPAPFIAVMADKSPACFAGILGCLMAGKAYMPLNPRFPAARNLFMLRKSGARIIIAGDNSDDELEKILENHLQEIYILFPEEVADYHHPDFVPRITDPSDPAYLLFTSGTTGEPKGVPVSCANVISYLDFMLETYDFERDDRFTQIFDLTFDLSVHDMLLAWSTGACLVVPDDSSSFAMSRFIRDKKPTVWFSVPSVPALMNRMRLLKPDTFPSLRLSFFCGEALMAADAGAWKKAAPNSALINLYGPTEATIAISGYDLPADETRWKTALGIVSIGKIFKGNKYLILRENPADTRGELCLCGNQVVEKYLDNEEADIQSFFVNTDDKERYYKTGDMVSVDEHGDLFYLGRKDSEVKISGYRVNLKEVEDVLRTYEAVAQAVVIYHDKSLSLLAFLVLSGEPLADPVQILTKYSQSRLPWYMVPGKFIFVNEIPLNDNGKIDRKQLMKEYDEGN